MCSLNVTERGWRCSASPPCLARGVIFERRRDRGVVCVFSIFYASGSVCGCMCVYTHTHAHTAQMGYSVVSPGVGMRHLEGPKNPDGVNLGMCIFVYVYKIHLCVYMLGDIDGVQRFESILGVLCASCWVGSSPQKRERTNKPPSTTGNYHSFLR